MHSYSNTIQILGKLLGCDLTLHWIHHKFQKLNLLRKIRSFVALESQYMKTERPALVS